MYDPYNSQNNQTYPEGAPHDAAGQTPRQEQAGYDASPVYSAQPSYVPPVYHTVPPQDPQPQKPKKKSGAGKIIALALCFSLLGGILGAGSVLAVNALSEQTKNAPSNVSTILEGNRQPSVINVSNIDTSKEMTAAEVYAANVNSTVGITTSVVTTNIFGYSTSAIAGSGFILSDDGYIVTNYHVIDGASSVKVTTYDGTAYDATLVGGDESNDIAVLKIEAENLTPVILGDSDNLNVGDSVIAIGNPLGELTFSLTSGVVSALDRKVTLSSNVTMELIQTDCAINSGNSGGALFNLYGEVIGITNAKYSSSGLGSASIDNICFAIPISNVREIIESIIEKGYVSKPYVGLTVTSVSEEYQAYGLPQGAAVKSVVAGSPAENAGLKANDIITAVNGETITSHSALVELVSKTEIGTELKLTVYRQGSIMELTLTVGEQKQPTIMEENSVQEEQQSSQNTNPFPWGYIYGR